MASVAVSIAARGSLTMAEGEVASTPPMTAYRLLVSNTRTLSSISRVRSGQHPRAAREDRDRASRAGGEAMKPYAG